MDAARLLNEPNFDLRFCDHRVFYVVGFPRRGSCESRVLVGFTMGLLEIGPDEAREYFGASPDDHTGEFVLVTRFEPIAAPAP